MDTNEITNETSNMTNRVKEWQQRATELARNAGITTDRYVRENTWMAIGAAALLGCIVGYLLANRGED